jgi:Ca2+-binding RTX toxin-like protein
MDIKGTRGDDTIVQDSITDEWNGYFGLEGNDTIRIYQGGAIGGPGNDRIEAIPTPDWWRTVEAAYWDSPGDVLVDLAAGYAEDGWGTRDTLIGVRNIAGSWGRNRLYGDANDNSVNAGGGHTITDGRGGEDYLWLPNFREGMDISEFKIEVSIDGKSGVVTAAGYPDFRLEFSNFEYIGVGWNVRHLVSDFIQPEQMAREGLVGLDNQRWNAGSALGTSVELTFAFATTAPASGPGATGFAAFTEAQKAAVRAILDSASKLTGLTFREVAPGASKLLFGASAQANTKGVAAMPGQTNAGQVWMDVDSLRDLAPGTEGYAALLHEIGHALGLRHPRNVDTGDVWGAQWREQDDVTSYSVMAHGASSDGLFPSTWGALDVAALRHLYGTRNTAATDTVYKLGAAQFEAQTSITDDGGNDTIDASSSAFGVSIDLTPGALSSVGVTKAGAVAVGNLVITPGSWIEAATGSQYDDVLTGNARDNSLRGGLGNDWIDGAAGTDTAVFEGKRSDYLLSTGFGKVFVTARDGSSGFDTLVNVEKLQFSDGTLAFNPYGLASDITINVDQNATTSGTLPEASNGTFVTYKIKTAPAHGTLTLSPLGGYTYTPQRGYAAEDRFVYTVSDAYGSNDYIGFVGVRQLPSTLAASEGNDNLAGTAGDDTVLARGGSDRIAGSGGFDQIDGGAGVDFVTYAGARSSVKLARNEDGSVSATKAAGMDHLVNVERVLFDNGKSAVAFDIDGAAGQTYRVYKAAFNREPDIPGLSFWMYNMDNGSTLQAVAAEFMKSPEFAEKYGANPSAEVFVEKLYTNVLGRDFDRGGYEFWVNAIKSGFSRAEILVLFAEGAENRAQVIAAIEGGIEYTPFGT